MFPEKQALNYKGSQNKGLQWVMEKVAQNYCRDTYCTDNEIAVMNDNL